MVKTMDSVVELEVNTSKNANLYFAPIQRTVRGRFDIHRALQHDRDMAGLLTRWPVSVIPGQRLRLNLETREAELIESLYDPENLAIKEAIEARGMRLEPQSVKFSGVDLATWVYWLRSALSSNKMTLVRGVLPDNVPGKVQTRFHSPEPPADPLDRLTAALEKQSDLLGQVLAKLVK